jgi:hypothetical protein|tara:strand:+ start:2963 stop:4144 length:1182 start_codon:yes stop_codon:yes gene_type:complete
MDKKEETIPQEGEFKMKKKRGRPRKLNKDSEVIKVDLSKKEKDAVQEQSPEEPVLQSDEQSKEKETSTEVELQEVGETHEEQKPTEEGKKEEIGVIQEIVGEEQVEEPAKEEVKEEIEEKSNIDLPENVEKLVSFMKETGGSVEDYVRLNADYSNVSNDALLKEYYKNTKPHLDSEEIDFIMEDKFLYDEDYDDEKQIRKKKLAYKEEVAKAKTFLEDLKSKYYDEIKLRPGVTQEQQKAMDFFNRYNKEQEKSKKQHENFKATTKKFFSEDFKGFDFNLGEKRFRYGVQNPSQVADVQSDLSNFVGKFLNEDGSVNDHQGYHKALYAARNADTIAKHFYEQGKADATKDIAAKSKNISNEPRTNSGDGVFINGLRVKAISGVDSSKLKIRKR